LDIQKYFIILYWQNKSERDKLKIIPHGNSDKRGVFPQERLLDPILLDFVWLKLKERGE